MAFVSMIFGFILLACIVLVLMLIVGVILLIIGLINRKKEKFAGKKSPVVCIVSGILLIIPSVIITLSAVASFVISVASKNGYDNIADEWRNEWVTDQKAADEAIKALLGYADDGNQAAFAELFTPNLQNTDSFENQIDEFFEVYPTGLSLCELEGGLVSSSASYDYGERERTGSTDYTCYLDGEWYTITLGFCHDNTSSPDDVGITFFCIENLEADASDIEYSSDTCLACSLFDESQVTARLIHNNGFVFNDSFDREITQEQMSEYLSSYDNLRELAEIIGMPNVAIKYDNCTGYDYYYELCSENGEPRYAYICTSNQMGRVLYAYVCSDTEAFYDEELV